MTSPLPVDVTSTWWDYVVDTADVLAGLGATGALLVPDLAQIVDLGYSWVSELQF